MKINSQSISAVAPRKQEARPQHHSPTLSRLVSPNPPAPHNSYTAPSPNRHDHLQQKTTATTSPLPLNFAVLGCPGSGKTTFTQNALSLTSKQQAPAKAKLASVGRQIYSIRFFEFTFDQVPVRRDGWVAWPDAAQTIPLDHVDGVFILYDPTNGSSLDPVSKYLASFQSASLPAALVAAKWDLRPPHRRLAPDQIEQSKLLSDRSLALQATSAQPETAQRCLSALLSAATQSSRSRPEQPVRTLRPRRHTANLRASSPPSTAAPKHSRATSELSVLVPKTTNVARDSHSKRNTGLRSPLAPTQPASASRPHIRVVTSNMLSVPASPENTSPRSFLNVEDSPYTESRLSSDSDASSQHLELNLESQTPVDSSLFTFEELVDRLLTAPHSEADAKFQTSFLTLYRLFAAPLELLSAILHHFAEIQDPANFMKDLASPSRDLTVLNQWLTSYPGDFARSVTQKKLRNFLNPLKEEAEYVAMAKHLLAALAQVSADDDTDWARTDDELTRPGTAHTFLSISSAGSNRPSFEDQDGSPDASLTRFTPKFNDSDSTLTPGPNSVNSSQTTVVSESALQKQANSLIPRPRFALTKNHWRSFLQQPDEDIAREFTRMDRIMLLLIKPRDLVRHVNLTPDARTQFPGTENVNRMIDHFNHIAFFVTNIILFRDKPKHRAQALDKMMRVGRELRKLNNYNALGAVVAGIRGSAVQRLAQTWDLLSEERRRDFLKLEILMGTNRGHAAYRMAWENSFGERIPFLPLHRRDLVVAEQGNKTFGPADSNTTFGQTPSPSLSRSLADLQLASRRISWRKFEIMGDVLIGVRDAQSVKYTGLDNRHDDVRILLLEGRIIKDEEKLYERSVQLEAGSTANLRGEGGGLGGLDISSVRRRLNPFLARYGIV